MRRAVDIAEIDSANIAEVDSVEIVERNIAETVKKKIVEIAKREITKIAERKIAEIVKKKIVEIVEIAKRFIAELKIVVEIDLSNFLYQMKSFLKRSALMQILYLFILSFIILVGNEVLSNV